MGLRELLAGLALLAAPAAGAEIYRCVEPDGSVRFTNDAAGCPGASPHALKGEIQRPSPLAPDAPPDDGASAGGGAPWSGTRAALLSFFVPAGGDWEIVEEAPTDPAADPDLWSHGVRSMAARHYTRARGADSQVCSIEIWAFEAPEHVGAVRLGLTRPGWRFHQEGNLLVMLRGVTLQRGQGFRKGLFPECEELAERIRARVAARVR